MAKLSHRTLCRKPIDMEYVYTQIEEGRTVQSIAEELHVSRSTIYRRHAVYQKSKAENVSGNPINRSTQTDEFNPFE